MRRQRVSQLELVRHPAPPPAANLGRPARPERSVEGAAPPEDAHHRAGRDLGDLGDVPNVIFSCTNLVVGDELRFYYAGADRRVGLATVPFADVRAFAREGE
ncbi:MAG: hypothetical protein IPK19_17075 [Chloroflexi bacterium]|nr:hypothetical protein [Chloroflexota bacterium]